jgi:hypothetical protein
VCCFSQKLLFGHGALGRSGLAKSVPVPALDRKFRPILPSKTPASSDDGASARPQAVHSKNSARATWEIVPVGGENMTKVIQCPCGYSMREEDDDAHVRSAQAHAMAAHGLELTREQALAMAKPELVRRKESRGKGTQV